MKATTLPWGAILRDWKLEIGIGAGMDFGMDFGIEAEIEIEEGKFKLEK